MCKTESLKKDWDVLRSLVQQEFGSWVSRTGPVDLSLSPGAPLHLGRWRLLSGGSLRPYPLWTLRHGGGSTTLGIQRYGGSQGVAGVEWDVGSSQYSLQVRACGESLGWLTILAEDFGTSTHCDEYVLGHWKRCDGQCGDESNEKEGVSKEGGHVHILQAIRVKSEFLRGASTRKTCILTRLLLSCTHPLGHPCRSTLLAASRHVWWPWR